MNAVLIDIPIPRQLLHSNDGVLSPSLVINCQRIQECIAKRIRGLSWEIE